MRKGKHRRKEGTRRADGGPPPAAAGHACRAEADHRGDEVMRNVTFRLFRGDAQGGGFKDYTTDVAEGMVVLDAVLQIQAEKANDLAARWNCKAGKCGSCSAEIN